MTNPAGFQGSSHFLTNGMLAIFAKLKTIGEQVKVKLIEYIFEKDDMIPMHITFDSMVRIMFMQQLS